MVEIKAWRPAFSNSIDVTQWRAASFVVDYDSTIDPSQSNRSLALKRKEKEKISIPRKDSDFFLGVRVRYFWLRFDTFLSLYGRVSRREIVYFSISYRANGPCERSLFAVACLLPRIIVHQSVRMNLHDFSTESLFVNQLNSSNFSMIEASRFLETRYSNTSSLNNSLEDYLSARKLYKVKRVGAQSLPPRLIEFIQRLHFVKIDHAAECGGQRSYFIHFYPINYSRTTPAGRERSFPIPPRKTRPSKAIRG